MDFTRKIPSLVSLIASSVCNDSFGMKGCIYWTRYWNMRSGESIKSNTVRIRPMPFWTKLYFSYTHTIIIYFRVYQRYLSSQSNAFTIILNHVSHPSSKRLTTTPSIVSTKVSYHFNLVYVIMLFYLHLLYINLMTFFYQF